MKAIKILFSLILLTAFLGCTVEAARVVEKEVYLSNFTGDVKVLKARTKAWIAAKKDMVLGRDDRIKTAKGAYAEISFDKQGLTMVSMQENSDMTIGKLRLEPRSGTEVTHLQLDAGSVLTKVNKLTTKQSEFKIKTPTAIVGVRGTGFQVTVAQ